MIISLGGDLGSGKSTLAKKIAEVFGLKHYSMGQLHRDMAIGKGLTLAEHNKQAELNPQIDLEVDNYQKILGEKEDNFVIEGRTSWHFIPHSFKIYLKVSEKIGAERILLAKREGEDEKMNDAVEVLESLKKRKDNEKKRYLEFFGIDISDLNNYDLILDTSSLGADEVFEEIKKILTKEKGLSLAIDK